MIELPLQNLSTTASHFFTPRKIISPSPELGWSTPLGVTRAATFIQQEAQHRSRPGHGYLRRREALSRGLLVAVKAARGLGASPPPGRVVRQSNAVTVADAPLNSGVADDGASFGAGTGS